MAGKKGRSGRKSFELTLRAQTIVERAQLLEVAETIATDKKQKAADRLKAVQFLVEYAYGKPTQPVSAPPGTSFTLKFGDPDD